MDEPGWFGILLFLGAGFFLLAKGADWLVGGSSLIARRFGVSTLVVGLTFVAWGTSAPEVVVSSMAAWRGSAAISLGNVLGSNIANIGLVLGASAVVLPRVLESRLGGREAVWLFVSFGSLWAVLLDGDLTRAEGILLLLAFAAYNLQLVFTTREVDPGALERHAGHRLPWIAVAVGSLSIAIGAYLVVEGSVAGALRLGIDESFVGLTVLAVGTSLPELAAGLGGAVKGESDISLGNVVGSNVFNVLGVMGIVALIQPLSEDAVDPGQVESLRTAFHESLTSYLPMVAAFSLAALLLPLLGGARAGRAKGLLLVLVYFSYIAWLYLSQRV